MLPTPSTSHVCFDTIYEPAEDSYLLLDTLSSESEAAWLTRRFNRTPHTTTTNTTTVHSSASTPQNSAQPIVVEVGTGSGVVLAFVAANAKSIFGRPDILTLGTDVNANACSATRETVRIALDEKKAQSDGGSHGEASHAQLVAAMVADLCTPFRPGVIDVLIFNPPYVPTPEVPQILSPEEIQSPGTFSSKFERDSHLLSLSYAGGDRGMETTNRLLEAIPNILNAVRGVAYVLLCAQNKPDEVMDRIRCWGSGWNVEIVGRSGVKAGWERLVIIRIWKDTDKEDQQSCLYEETRIQ
ncbi:hypothetical protein VTO42DRAFT_3730 [Malbranchea cinnamomea]